MSIEEENRMLREQIRQMAAMIGIVAPAPVGLVSQRKAKKLFGATWLQEKNKDAKESGVNLWVRTGEAYNSPKKYSLSRLYEILEWEKENGLPYPFEKESKARSCKRA